METFRPLVSIIIPVYNGGNYMREAIDSALAQTYANCEVLVVNDGSTDGGITDEIAKSYGDRIRYFYKSNGGVASALNFGLREMNGDYFSWLSHDDVYLPDKVEQQINYINRFELFTAVIYSDYEEIDAQGNYLETIKLPDIAPEHMFRYIYNRHHIHGCTLLIPRKAFELMGGFPEYLPSTQDYSLWLRICRSFSFFRTAHVLVRSRLHHNQGSRILKTHWKDVRKFYKENLPTLLEPPIGYQFDKFSASVWGHQVLREALQLRFDAQHYGAGLDTLRFALWYSNSWREKLDYLRISTRPTLRKLFSYLPSPLSRCFSAIEWLYPKKLENKAHELRQDTRSASKKQ